MAFGGGHRQPAGERITLYVDGVMAANSRTPTRPAMNAFFSMGSTSQGGPSQADIAALDILGEHLTSAAVAEMDWKAPHDPTKKGLVSLDFSRMADGVVPNRWGTGFDAQISGAEAGKQGDTAYATLRPGSLLTPGAGWDVRLHGFPPAQVAPASWRHVVVLHDGSGRADGAQFYIDGRQLPLEIISASVPDKPVPFDELVMGENCLVSLDDVAFFHMPVSSDERRVLMHAWHAFTETGPLADGTSSRHLDKGKDSILRVAGLAAGTPGKAAAAGAEIERLSSRYLGTLVHAIGEVRKNELMAMENDAMEKAWQDIEKQAATLAAQKSPAEASKWVHSYTGPYANELKARRSTLQGKLNANQQALDKTNAEQQKAANEAQYTALANHLARMEFDEAAALAKAQSGKPFSKAEVDLVNQMLEARKAFFATFASQNGQRVSVELTGGRVNAFILGVAPDSLAVTVTDPQGRNQQLTLNMARFAPPEIYRRLGRVDTKGAQMLRAIMVYHGPKKKEAEAEMKTLAPSLADKITPALDAAKQ
jgi:hypothetical protein